jgi:hypothetical protein
MKKFTAFLVVAATLTLAAGSLLAHHGRGATYDADKEVTLTGVVTELAWRNPHVAIYLDVKGQDGKVVNWAFESSNVSTMSREGWNRTILKPGQEITVTFNPSRAGAPIGIVRSVKLADGKEIRSRGNANTID